MDTDKILTELPADVNVETVTFLAFEDGRPSQMVMAGTTNDKVKVAELNGLGQRMLTTFLQHLVPEGIAAVNDVSAG